MLKVALFLYALVLTSFGRSMFFRKDYFYFKEFDAFYKLHWDHDGTSLNGAVASCDSEGAKLFYPKEKSEWEVVKNLTSTLVEMPNTTNVLIGIYVKVALGQNLTINGIPSIPSEVPSINEKYQHNQNGTCANITRVLEVTEGENCVIKDLLTEEYKIEDCVTTSDLRRLYVCKMIDDRPCPTIDRGYQFKKLTNKCYKVNLSKRTWREAYHTCKMEGGILFTPESAIEDKLVFDTILAGQYGAFFAGFRRIFPGSDFYTIKGRKLRVADYERWFDKLSGDYRDCSAVYKLSNTLFTKSIDCNYRLPFICEMQASGISY